MNAEQLVAEKQLEEAVIHLADSTRHVKDAQVYASNIQPGMDAMRILKGLLEVQAAAVDRVLLAFSVHIQVRDEGQVLPFILPRAETHPDEHRAGCDCASCRGRV